MNLILKYIYCLFIIINVCAEITVTEIGYVNHTNGLKNTIFHLHNQEENLSKLGLKCNNSKELLYNIKNLITSGVVIYSGEHYDEDDDSECKKVNPNNDIVGLLRTLKMLEETNKFVIYSYKDRMSLDTNDILIHHRLEVIPYSSEYENNYYYENIKESIRANFSRYKNYSEWDCNDLRDFMKSLETEDNKKLFPDNAEFGFYTKVFDKNGEEKFVQIKNSDNLVNLTNIFVTLPSYCYGEDVKYSDPEEVAFSNDSLKPYKIPEKDLIKLEDEIKDEIEDEIKDKMKDKIKDEIGGKIKMNKDKKKINSNKKSTIPEQKIPNGNGQSVEKRCCESCK